MIYDRAWLAPGGALELMGGKEVGELLGVAPGNLPKLQGMPDPVVTYLSRGSLWLRADIEAYARERASPVRSVG